MKVDKKKPFKTAIKILKISGFWLGKYPSKYYMAYGIIMHCFLLDLFVILQVAFLLLSEKQTISDFNGLITYFPTFFGFTLKTLNIMTKSSEIEKLFEMTDELLKECSDSSRIVKRLKTVDRFFKVFLIFALASVVGGIMSINKTLPVNIWFPYDTESSFIAYCVVAIYVNFISSFCAICTGPIDMITVFFMCYSVGFWEVLCDRLEDIQKKVKSTKDGEDLEVNNYDKLIKCMEFQLKIDEYLKEFQNIFSKIFFAQGFIGVVTLCTSTISLTFVRIFF